MVGNVGLEPTTSCSQSRRADQTVLIPVIAIYIYIRNEYELKKMDAPSGLEPELFGIKIRRVANYTKGQYRWWESEVSILPRERIRFTV